MVIQIFYAIRFLFRINQYVKGQCPGGKMCSIGKYRKKVIGLEPTFWAGVSGSCFLLLQNLVRISTHDLSRWQAFYAHYILLDSLMYLFYISIFCFACLNDIPSVSDTPRKVVFYVSRPTALEPRRPTRWKDSASDPVPGSSTQTEHVNKKPNIKIPKLTHVQEYACADRQMTSTSKQHRFVYLTKN